ncbi:class I SAM-dependent methyltransferase [Labrenzia sp. VG12]|uniref:class I SAM-dependent methyltransferase n=1 Tax=Labrenzia sp. VG12 TaxID=2021862 RepID=UPI000B8C3A69|nr:class I SAM-dependent methyltransferase [Labrenzia sp. VG12]ASP36530.1 ubiquinone biosynthesis methyltransferase UbiE [Labrenzia sp. VG12]
MAITWTNDMTPSTRFWDKAARKYAASKIKDQAAYEKTLERTTEHLGPEDHVLELGAGTGSTALLLAKNVKSFLSTDFAPGMIEIANEKLAAERNSGVAHEGLSFLTADAFDERVQLPEEQGAGYDAILAFNFFHLVENPDDLLARVRDLLRPGGLYISKTVCLKDRAWLFGPMIKVMQLFGKAPYVSMFSFEDVEEKIRRAGFEIIETGTYPEPRSRFVVARKA